MSEDKMQTRETMLSQTTKPAPESGERYADAFLVEWQRYGEEWVQALADEPTAVDLARRMGGTCTPLYRCTNHSPDAANMVASLTSELATVKKRLESAEGLLTQWRTWACGQEGASPFQDTRTFLQEQEKQNG